MRPKGKWSELISYNSEKKEMDCETGRGRDNGFLCVCLMTWSDKKKKKIPTPPLPKGTWKCKQYKEGNFDISSDGAGGVGGSWTWGVNCVFSGLW